MPRIRFVRGAVAAALVAAGLMGGVASGSASPAAASTQQLTVHVARFAGAPASQAGGPSPSASVGSATCGTAQASSYFVAGTRFDWCARFGMYLMYYLDYKLMGTALIDVTDYASWSVSSRQWRATQELSEDRWTGYLMNQPVAVIMESACSPGCTVTSGGVNYVDVPYQASVPEYVSVSSAPPLTTYSTMSTTWTVSVLGLTDPGVATFTTSTVRCDSQVGNIAPNGCVASDYRTTYVVSRARFPTIAPFDEAQIAIHPFWATLHRTTDPAIRAANHAAACKGFVPKNPTDTCDEFPYQSTYEGGPGPPRAEAEHVPSSENSAQGGDLGYFYTSNRVIDGEPFNISFQ